MAEAAFADLVNRYDLDGQKLAAVLSYNNKQIAFHRFARRPGDTDYWRDKLEEIPWPHGGVLAPAVHPITLANFPREDATLETRRSRCRSG